MSEADRMTPAAAPELPAGPGPRASAPYMLCAAAAILVLVMAGLAVHRAQKRAPDWNHWEEETFYLRMNGRIAEGTSMYGYLPGAFFLLTAFTIWPREIGATLFALSNVLSVAAAAWAVARWWLRTDGGAGVLACQAGDGPGRPPHQAYPPHPAHLLHQAHPPRQATAVAAAALLLCGVSAADPFWANQLSLWILGLAVTGLTLVRRGWGFAGGLLLGASVVVKPIPGLLVVFCAWKRHWAAVAGAALAGFLLNIVPTIAFFGWYAPPESDPPTADRPPLVRGILRTVEAHRDWMTKAQDFGAYWCIEDPLYSRRSQAPPAVLARWLRAMPDSDVHLLVRDEHPVIEDGNRRMCDATREWVDWKARELGGRVSVTFLPGPPQGPYRSPGPEITEVKIKEIPRLNVADLSADTVRLIYRILMLAVIAVLLRQTCGAGARLDDGAWFAQAAVWMLAMFWLTPILSHNYLIWAYPAVALLVARVWTDGLAAPRAAAIAGVAVWLLGQALRMYGPAEFYGLNLIGTAALGMPLLLHAVRPAADAIPTKA